jgi:hypothetical protein
MRHLKRLAYPVLGLMMAFGLHASIDAPPASAQCIFYYGTANPNCYDEEIDSSPCVYYYGTQEGCRSRFNETVDESAEPLPGPSRPIPYGYPYAPGNYGNDSVTNGSAGQPYYGPSGQMSGYQGQMYGPQGPGMYGGPAYYGNQPAPYYGNGYYGR